MIVLAPAKSTCSQSGKLPGVPSCQPPPAPQLTPRRSPLIAPAAANPLSAEDAVAVAPALAAATFMPPLTGGAGAAAAASFTTTVHPAIVTVALRVAPVLAATVTVTAPLPEPPDVLSPTQVAPVSLAACQLQPDGAVTDTDVDPPAAENAIDVWDTEYVQVGVTGPLVVALNAATVEMVLLSARALFSFAVPAGRPLYERVGLDSNGIRTEVPYAISVLNRPDGLW